MNCDDYRLGISADLDGELAETEAVGLWSHLASCTDCRRWRRDQLTIRADFQKWPEETLPEAALPLPLRRTRPAAKTFTVPRSLAWAAGLVLLVQSVFSVTALVRTPPEAGPATRHPIESVETIVLSARDRISYKIVDHPMMDAGQNPETNGG